MRLLRAVIRAHIAARRYRSAAIKTENALLRRVLQHVVSASINDLVARGEATEWSDRSRIGTGLRALGCESRTYDEAARAALRPVPTPEAKESTPTASKAVEKGLKQCVDALMSRPSELRGPFHVGAHTPDTAAEIARLLEAMEAAGWLAQRYLANAHHKDDDPSWMFVTCITPSERGDNPGPYLSAWLKVHEAFAALATKEVHSA